MWAVLLSLRGGRLTGHVPGWLANSAASYAAIDYGGEIVAELRRDPVAYGYQSANRHDVVVGVWDAAIDNLPSLAFGRRKHRHRSVQLIPDVYYIQSRGYAHLRDEAARAPHWAERSPVVAWRGSVTGSGPYGEPGDIPRVRLAERCRAMPMTDVRLFDVHETMASVFPIDRIRAHLAAQDLLGDRWPLQRFGTHRHVIDIDGHANAWGFVEKLILGCCVLKVDTPYEQWFYDEIQPWVHYVPVAQDLSDLAEKIDWCLANEANCEWIGRNAAAIGAALDYESQLKRSCHAFMRAAAIAPM